MKQNIIYILNKKGKPLMPTKNCGYVRYLLSSGKAVAVNNYPFTIRLKYEVKDNTKPLYLGIDTGRENIGLSVSNETGECIFTAEFETHNKTIKKAMKDRSDYKDQRERYKRQKKQRKAIRNNQSIKDGKDSVLRSKKNCKSVKIKYPGADKPVEHKVIRGAEAQFCNRRREEDWLTPSAKQLIQMHMFAIKKVMEILPVTSITVERVRFDFQKLENANIYGWQYTRGPLYGYKSYKDYISDQQNRKCLLCNNKIEHYHHINQQKYNKYDNVANIAGLCGDCHTNVHNNVNTEEILKKMKNGLKQKYYVGLLNTVMPFLLEEIIAFCNSNNIEFQATDGKGTSETRKKYNIEKTHACDAYCICLYHRDIAKISKDIFSFKMCRFKKKSKNLIHKVGSRKYFYDDKLVAVNRHKAMDQKEDSLEEHMKKYSEEFGKEAADKHFHELVCEPAKRNYTYRKGGYVPPIRLGDIVKYKKETKKGEVLQEVFVCTAFKVRKSATSVEGNKIFKNVKYCRRIKTGCIQFIK